MPRSSVLPRWPKRLFFALHPHAHGALGSQAPCLFAQPRLVPPGGKQRVPHSDSQPDLHSHVSVLDGFFPSALPGEDLLRRPRPVIHASQNPFSLHLHAQVVAVPSCHVTAHSTVSAQLCYTRSHFLRSQHAMSEPLFKPGVSWSPTPSNKRAEATHSGEGSAAPLPTEPCSSSDDVDQELDACCIQPDALSVSEALSAQPSQDIAMLAQTTAQRPRYRTHSFSWEVVSTHPPGPSWCPANMLLSLSTQGSMFCP